MRILALLVSIVAFAWLFAYLASDEFDKTAMIGGSYGYIESGAKFGIYVGMSQSDARQILANRGLTPEDLADPERLVPPHTCLHRKYPSYRDIELWSDRSWRRGTICLSLAQGKVASVAWHYDTVPAL
jgi:hypothetical protein